MPHFSRLSNEDPGAVSVTQGSSKDCFPVPDARNKKF